MSDPIRVVVDTNVMIAALTHPRGAAARVVKAWREGRLELLSSEHTLREAELVLGAPWLARLASERQVGELLDRVRERSLLVRGRPVAGLRLKDLGDVRLVEAAAASGASYLVTSDRELLAARGYGSTEFVTPVELLRVLDGRRH